MPGNAAAGKPFAPHGEPKHKEYPESKPFSAKSAIVAGCTPGLNDVAGHVPKVAAFATVGWLQAVNVVAIAALATAGSKYPAFPIWFVSTVSKLCVATLRR